MAKIKVLLDTNFLLTMVRQKIHGLEEISQKFPAEYYTLSRVLYEIKGLARGDKKITNEAKIVEQVLKNNNVKVLPVKFDNSLFNCCSAFNGDIGNAVCYYLEENIEEIPVII